MDWEGGHNVRAIRHRTLVRSGTLHRLTARGWAAARDYGIRTIVDLRNPDEREAEPSGAPSDFTVVSIPLDQKHDRVFWDEWETKVEFGTPLYYQPHLERFPEVNAAVLKAIAHAEPGGVLFHCSAGRDRTGQIAMLLLAILGATAEEIGADYVLSYGHNPHHDGPIRQFLAERGTSAEAELARVLRTMDVLDVLRRGGATDRDFEALRARSRS